ncbi:MAG: CDP-diacylglycerol--serine O-phosphatidyltransferase [bacterium]|nr:CDP-diacylglycerol--serine O-phosphatidyltransferase [bacterium]
MRKIQLLPNLLTTANLVCGFLSIIFSIQENFIIAGWLIIVAIIFDALDGEVSRLTKTSSTFGLQYDSLADLISFAVAPAVLVYKSFHGIPTRLALSLITLYVVCGALRLARFNVQIVKTKDKFFVGLPIPAAAAIITTSTVAFHDYIIQFPVLRFFPIFMVVIAYLMVSKVRYPSLKEIERKRPFHYLVAILLILALIVVRSDFFMFAITFAYVLSGLTRMIKPLRKLFVLKDQAGRTSP